MTGQMEKLNWDAVVTKASANPLRALELGRSFSRCLELSGWACISLNQIVIEVEYPWRLRVISREKFN